MGEAFNKLSDVEKAAVTWGALQNYERTVEKGNIWAQAHKKEYMENAKEGIATSPEGVHTLLKEFQQNAQVASVESQHLPFTKPSGRSIV